jgi:hypothetical protein
MNQLEVKSMTRETVQLPKESVIEFLRPPIWDPIPPWLEFDKERLQRFAELEIQFKMKELQLQQEKLQEFTNLLR